MARAPPGRARTNACHSVTSLPLPRRVVDASSRGVEFDDAGDARYSSASPLCADDPEEVKNDQDVDGQSDRLERRCAANEFVQLERHEQ